MMAMMMMMAMVMMMMIIMILHSPLYLINSYLSFRTKLNCHTLIVVFLDLCGSSNPSKIWSHLSLPSCSTCTCESTPLFVWLLLHRSSLQSVIGSLWPDTTSACFAYHSLLRPKHDVCRLNICLFKERRNKKGKKRKKTLFVHSLCNIHCPDMLCISHDSPSG